MPPVKTFLDGFRKRSGLAANRRAGAVARISRLLSGLRRGPHVPRLSESRRPVPALRRGVASSPRRRFSRLSGDRHRRPHPGADHPGGGNRNRPARLGQHDAVAVARAGDDARPAAAGQRRRRRHPMVWRHARLRSGEEGARASAPQKPANAPVSAFSGRPAHSFCDRNAAGSATLIESTIEVGIRMVAPRSLVVS